MQEAEYRIDISYSGIKRIGATCCSGGDNEVREWIMEEMGPILKKYMNRNDRIHACHDNTADMIGMRVTGPLHLADDSDVREVLADIKRKLTIVFASKGLMEDKEFAIQCGLGRYDPSEYGISP